MPLEPGATLRGRYRVERLHKLGRLLEFGRMGAVYLATDLSLKVPVALKQNLVSGPEYVEQFQREAKFLATLRHPNLPRATDYFVVPGVGQYIVMSFIEGLTANEWAAQRSPGPAEIISTLHGVFAALLYIHSCKPAVVHRDVEPTNIIIADDGESFLVDFGLAKTLEEDPTPAATEARSDQYSLAATPYTLITGQVPANALDRVTGKADLISARSLNAEVPPHLDKALQRAMAMKREDRFPDVHAFWTALAGKSQWPTRPAAKHR
jgi:serine/threonine-protein kinase